MTGDVVEPTARPTTNGAAASLTREQLYELVWKEPMLRVGERLGVSSSYMSRVCTELRVPRPPRGYWSKLEFGKAPPRPALPSSRPGDVTEWRRGDFIGRSERTAKREPGGRTDTKAEAAVEVATQGLPPRASAAKRSHPLLVGVKPLFEKTRETDNGILRPFKRLLVDILSSKEKLDAAISAAECLFQALTARGHRVTLAPGGQHIQRAEVDLRETPRKNDRQWHSVWRPDRPTLVYVGDVPIGLTLFEMTEKTEMQYIGNGKYVPVSSLSETQRRRYAQSNSWTTSEDRACGRLRLQAYCPSWRVGWVKHWSESEAGQFTSMVPEIVRELEAAAPRLAEQVEAARIKAEEEHRKWEEEQRLRREAEARALREKRRQESRTDLLAAVTAWDEARAIAAYFSEAERAAQQLDAADRHRLLDRIALARELVGETSPLELLRRWKAPDERS